MCTLTRQTPTEVLKRRCVKAGATSLYVQADIEPQQFVITRACRGGMVLSYVNDEAPKHPT